VSKERQEICTPFSCANKGRAFVHPVGVQTKAGQCLNRTSYFRGRSESMSQDFSFSRFNVTSSQMAMGGSTQSGSVKNRLDISRLLVVQRYTERKESEESKGGMPDEILRDDEWNTDESTDILEVTTIRDNGVASVERRKR